MTRASHGLLVAVALGCAACADDAPGAGGGGGTPSSSASGGGGATADVTGSGAGGRGGGAGATCDGVADACADAFGDLFAPGNGRADGTLLAIVGTTDTQCTAYNDDHVVLQLAIDGAVQRLVVNVDGVAVAVKSAPLVGPPFAAGWHLGVELDYVVDLELHSEAFEQVTLEGAEAFLCEHLVPGDPISVFAYAEDNPSSAHQIHFNQSYPDGAIVANPTSRTPTYLAFRFADQAF